jgi:hypothetical protein
MVVDEAIVRCKFDLNGGIFSVHLLEWKFHTNYSSLPCTGTVMTEHVPG